MKQLLGILLLLTVIEALHAQTTVYSTNFGTSGTALPAGWTKSGTASAQVGVNSTNPSSGYSGSSASLNLVDGVAASASAGTVYVTYNNTATPLVTTGYNTVEIKFGAFKNGYVGSVDLEWSPDNTTWTPLLSNINVPTNSKWYGYGPYVLPAGALNQANLRFRFVFTRTAASSTASTNNLFRVDDFTVLGTIGSSGGGSGTVSSVGLSLPGEFSVSGSPVTTSGVLNGSWQSQTQNKVLAAPAAATGTPAFRVLESGDIPALDMTKVTTGNLPVSRLGTVTNARLLGRFSSGNGAAEEITIGSGLNLSGTGELTATATASPWTITGNDIYNSNTGNVGIGISAPAKKLDVAGFVRSDSGFTYGTTYGATIEAWGTFSRFQTNAATDGIAITTIKNPSSIRLQVNNGDRGVVMSGQTANFLFMGGSGETLSGIGNNNGTGNLALLYSTAANVQAEGARLNTSGNFLIGTTADNGKKLTVNGNASINNRLTGDNANTYLELSNANGSTLHYGSIAEGSQSSLQAFEGALTATINGNEAFRIHSNSRVGIGTPSPSAQLHTTGSVRFQGLGANNANTNILAADANGNLAWRDAATLSGSALSFGNGLTQTGNNVKFGGITNEDGEIKFKGNIDLNWQGRLNWSQGTLRLESTDTTFGSSNYQNVIVSPEERTFSLTTYHAGVSSYVIGSPDELLLHGGGVVTLSNKNNSLISIIPNYSQDADMISMRAKDVTGLLSGNIDLQIDPQKLNLLKNNISVFRISDLGNIYSSSLSGSGTRMLVTDASGNISAQALPGGSGAWTSSGNDIYNTNTANVGIGTSTPAQKLDVNGSAIFRNHVTANYGVANRTAQLRDNGLFISRISEGSYVSSITADGSMYYDTRNEHIFRVDGTQKMVLAESGRLGLGTVNPEANLHVVPATSYTTIDATPSFLIKGPITTANIAMGVSGAGGTSNVLQSRDGVSTAYSLAINPFGGSVGVGTFNPTAKFHTNGTLRFDGLSNNDYNRILVTDSLGNVSWRDASALGGGGSSPWTISGNDIYNSNSANVGVGVNSPTAKLHTNGTLRFQNLVNSGFDRVLVTDSNGYVYWRDAASITGTPLSFANGLTRTGDNIRLGGSISQPTLLTAANLSNYFEIKGYRDSLNGNDWARISMHKDDEPTIETRAEGAAGQAFSTVTPGTAISSASGIQGSSTFVLNNQTASVESSIGSSNMETASIRLNNGTPTPQIDMIITRDNNGNPVKTSQLSLDSAGLKFNDNKLVINNAGRLSFNSYKNNFSRDSVLTTDVDGNMVFRYIPVNGGNGGNTQLYHFVNGFTNINDSVYLGGTLNDDVTLDLDSNHSFNIYNGSASVLTTNAAGNVGVGTTPSAFRFAVNGDMTVGNNFDSAGIGSKLYFNGTGNADNVWMGRRNISANATELRMNIGDYNDNADKLVIGGENNGADGDRFIPGLVVMADGRMGVQASQINSPLSVGKSHGILLSSGSAAFGQTTVLRSGTDGVADFTDLMVPGAFNIAKLRINSLGNVGIGTDSIYAGYRLSVNGKIRATGLKIQTGWADYVFDNDYQLRPLSEVEKFILANKRLPGMPSAAQIEKEGNDLGENQVKLLEKVEELTLYIIEQNKKITGLEKKNQQLEAQNRKIENLQQQLDELKTLLQNSKK